MLGIVEELVQPGRRQDHFQPTAFRRRNPLRIKGHSSHVQKIMGRIVTCSPLSGEGLECIEEGGGEGG
jgi:hypothetical protein